MILPFRRMTVLQYCRSREVSTSLDSPAVAEGARRLAIGLLRKGGGMFSRRFHDYNLADDVFASPQQTTHT